MMQAEVLQVYKLHNGYGKDQLYKYICLNRPLSTITAKTHGKVLQKMQTFSHRVFI